jgi:hypothetical protein
MPRGISRFDEAAFQGRLWTPQVDGKAVDLWFDIADLGRLSTGALGITDWRDKSGNLRNLAQTTTTIQPTFNASDSGNLGSVLFDGGDKLENASAGTLNITNSSFVFVVRWNSGSGADVPIGLGPLNSGSPNASRVIYNSAGGNLTFGCWNNDITSGFSVNVGGGFNIFTVIQSSQNISFYKNGSPDSTLPRTLGSAPLAVSTDRVNLGNSQQTDGFSGALSEVLVFYRAESYSYLEKIEGYLAWKWNLAGNLGAGHRFVSRPPMIGD